MLNWPPFYPAGCPAQYTFITRAKLFPVFLQIVQVPNHVAHIYGAGGVTK